jgi:uncharacterized protein (TIGR02217 family)
VNAVAASASPLRPGESLLTVELWMGGALFDVGTADIHNMTLNLHVADPGAIGDGNPAQERYQLLKRYDDGVNTDDRWIQAPIDAITLKDGIVTATGATVDYATGLVTISPPPANTLTWSGAFDVVCRFDTDQMNLSIDGAPDGYIGNWESIPLIEVRI